MIGFAWMFWLVPLLFFVMMSRHWRAERWARHRDAHSPRLELELDRQREYVDGLEQRVAELEERLDFTERLLAERNQVAPGPV
jgi:uncharacterized protein YlxW (UPF0749 family)